MVGPEDHYVKEETDAEENLAFRRKHESMTVVESVVHRKLEPQDGWAG